MADNNNGQERQSRKGRIDSVEFDYLNKATSLCASAFNEYETAVNGNLLFSASTSLRTIDWHRVGRLLPSYDDNDASDHSQVSPKEMQILCQNENTGQFLAMIDDFLSEQEMDEILQHDWPRQHFHYNRGDRVIVIDKEMSSLVWDRLTPVLTLNSATKYLSQPLGFGVSGVEWELNGINPAMRINTYRKNQIFDKHRDAQFCQSRRRRSVLSLIIYLSEVPQGGETCFHVPNEDAVYGLPPDPMSIQQELEFYDSHSSADLNRITVAPVRGRCVLFSHDLIHESLPFEGQEDTAKIILRTDMVAECDKEPYFADHQEVVDYKHALALFKEAEQKELEAANYLAKFEQHGYDADRYQNQVRFMNDECNHYYSRSLYLRYRYPRILFTRNADKPLPEGEYIWRILGGACAHIMKFLPPSEAAQLTVVFPFLKPCLHGIESSVNQESLDFAESTEFSLSSFEPQRRFLVFSVRSTSFEDDLEAWCRVAAVLVAYKVSHSVPKKDKTAIYCARFIPQTGEVIAVSLERLVFDAFHKRRSYGAVYSVDQQGEDPNVETDFAASVERGTILRDHGLEFLGENAADRVHFETRPTRRLAWDEDEDLPYQSESEQSDPDGSGRCVADFFKSQSRTGTTPNLPTPSKKPCIHMFEEFDTRHVSLDYEMIDHVNIDDWSVRFDGGGRQYKRIHTTNHLIFDFERYNFDIRREPDSTSFFKYKVHVADMMRDVEPFYHAAANTYHGSMALSYLVHQGAVSAFDHRWEDGTYITMKANRSQHDERVWNIRAEWRDVLFPSTL